MSEKLFLLFWNNSIFHERKLQVAFIVIITGSNFFKNPNFSEDSKRAVDYIGAELKKLRPFKTAYLKILYLLHRYVWYNSITRFFWGRHELVLFASVKSAYNQTFCHVHLRCILNSTMRIECISDTILNSLAVVTISMLREIDGRKHLDFFLIV